jgi:hypothetical protein
MARAKFLHLWRKRAADRPFWTWPGAWHRDVAVLDDFGALYEGRQQVVERLAEALY